MKKVFKFFIQIIRSHIKWECIGLLFSVIYSISVFLTPRISRFIVDEILGSSNFHSLYKGLVLFFLVCFSQTVSAYCKTRIFAKISENITLSLRKKILHNIIYAPISFFEATSKGIILSRFVGDTGSISGFITDIFVVLIKNILLVIVLLWGMFLMSWQITSLVLLFIVMYISISALTGKKFKSLSNSALHNNDILYKCFNQSIGIPTLIKISKKEKACYEINENNVKNIYQTNLKSNNFNNLITSSLNVVIVAALSIIYGMGSVFAMHKMLTVGSIVALGVYFQILVGPISELINSNIRLHAIIPIVERLNEYLNISAEHKSICKTQKNDDTYDNPCIIFDKVCFRNNSKEYQHILEDISFVCHGKGLFGLFGMSGCGKTSIFKLLMQLYTPLSGGIMVITDDEIVDTVSKLRDIISYVPQNFEFINASIIKNLKLFAPDVADEEVIKICKQLNMHDKIMSSPNGYSSIMDEHINLSEGEKQRLCIARAILKKASIYLLDEPTSSLDRNSQAMVQEIIKELAKVSLVFVISHNIELFKEVKHIIYLKNGKIVKEYSYDDLSKLVKIS